MKDILSIGTIVKLQNDSKVKFMIVGYYPTNQSGEQRDYSAIRYPMGVYDNRMFFFFNDEDICEILHKGYVDDDFESMIALLKNAKDINQGSETKGI